MFFEPEKGKRHSQAKTFFAPGGKKANSQQSRVPSVGSLLLKTPNSPPFLFRQNLGDGEFICVIPRLPYTPSESALTGRATKGSSAKATINAKTREKDHAKLRGLIVLWVRETKQKVLACPEMAYEVELAKEELVNPLPEDVKPYVVWRDSYWMPEEAAAIYARAAAVISFECHSPIIALANGTPAFYVRQPTDTIKGRMYHDIGAEDWIFEIDEAHAEQLWARLRTIHEAPSKLEPG